jgi:hypothetical protein
LLQLRDLVLQIVVELPAQVSAGLGVRDCHRHSDSQGNDQRGYGGEP